MTEQGPSLGAWVKAARTERGWSKEEAARHADISAITWKRVEDGLRVHDSKLAAVLRVLEFPDTAQRVDGDTPLDDLVEFTIEGNFGVKAVVKGPIRDIDALQAAVSRLVAGMQTSEADETPST